MPQQQSENEAKYEKTEIQLDIEKIRRALAAVKWSGKIIVTNTKFH